MVGNDGRAPVGARQADRAETKAIVAFLGSLKGELPKDLIKPPELPPGAEGEAAAAEVPKPTPI